MTYAYDYQGRRVRKTVNGGLTTIFCYDGDQVIADYNEAGVWKRRYYYGPGIDEPICMVRYPGALPLVNYYHFDGLGSVVAMSAYSGVLVEKYTYDVYGKPTIKSPTGEPRATSNYDNRYMFTGREYDSETGNYYYRARYYKPSIGRFMQADPIGYEDGLNLYTYCRNNSINLLDPYGDKSCSTTPTTPKPPREYRVDRDHYHYDKKFKKKFCPHWHYMDYNWSPTKGKWMPGGWKYGGPGSDPSWNPWE